MQESVALSPDEAAMLAPDRTTGPVAGAARPVAGEPAPAAGAVRPYDLVGGERVPRGGLPALELVHERFAQHLREALTRYLRVAPGVSVQALRVPRFQAFLESLPPPASLHLVRLAPLRGCGLVVCDQTLVDALVDCLFGGTGEPLAGARSPASATVQRIAARLLELAAVAYTRAWEPVHPVRMEPAATETEPRFAAVAEPSEAVVTAAVEISLAGGGGALHLCVPYGALEPIRPHLQAAPRPGKDDRRWQGLIGQQIGEARVELAAELAHSALSVRELLALRPGDFVALERRDTLTVTVDGVPVFECDYGTLGARYGLRIQRFLTPPATNS